MCTFKDRINVIKKSFPNFWQVQAKDNLSKDECKALKELQSNTSIVILPADKGRSTIILKHEDYLEKCMDHINNGPY